MKNQKKKIDKKLFFLCALLCFISLSLTAFGLTRGDVNNDGSITIVDALLVAQYSAGLEPVGFVQEAADVNQDGLITVVDALLIARYSAGSITQFPTPTPTPTRTPTPTCPPCERIETGTVTNQDGQPLAGALIYEGISEQQGSLKATTDAQGKYTYTATGTSDNTGCPIGDFYIIAAAEGYQSSKVFVSTSCRGSPRTHNFRLLPIGYPSSTPRPSSTPVPTCPACSRTETGTVTNQTGQPVAGAAVYEGGIQKTTTDTEGYFFYSTTGTSSNPGCPATTANLTVKAAGYYDGMALFSTVCHTGPAEHNIVLTPLQ